MGCVGFLLLWGVSVFSCVGVRACVLFLCLGWCFFSGVVGVSLCFFCFVGVCVCVLKEMLSQCAAETGHAWRPGGKQEQVFSGQTRLAIKEHTFDEHLEQGMAKIEEKMGRNIAIVRENGQASGSNGQGTDGTSGCEDFDFELK